MFVIENTSPPVSTSRTKRIGIKLPDFIRVNGTNVIITAADFEKIRADDGTITIDITKKEED